MTALRFTLRERKACFFPAALAAAALLFCPLVAYAHDHDHHLPWERPDVRWHLTAQMVGAAGIWAGAAVWARRIARASER